ncbi:MAG: acyltransferase family protein [Saprospiraceae bacterium]
MAQNIYFSGLNGLRFFAAFLVVITHSESIRAKLGFFNISAWSISRNGGLAVQFFFVLSGFLITYLLFQENKKTNNISIKHFYFRRILRIWPLYYLMAIVGLFLLPYVVLPLIHQSFTPSYELLPASALILLFLPNLANSFWETHHLHSLWSIGVEEQFYLVWAPLLKYFRRYFVPICVFIIVLKIAVYYWMLAHMPHTWQTHFISSLQFECMAIGGLGAYWLFAGGKVSENVWFRPWCQVVVFALIGSMIFANLELAISTAWWAKIWQLLFRTPLYPVVSNLLFVYLILNVSQNPSRLFDTNNKIFNFLGEISYGIYMYHPLVVHFVILVAAQKILFLPPWIFLTTMYLLTMLVLIGISYLSYIYFEKPILKLKNKLI